MGFFDQEMWEDLIKYKPVADLVSVELPLTQKNHTYTLKLDYKALGDLFEKAGNKVINNVDSIIKKYVEIDQPSFISSVYDDKTGTYQDVEYDTVDAYYQAEMKDQVDEIVGYIKKNHWIERINYFIKAYCYGTSLEVNTTLEDNYFSNEIKGHLQFLKANVLDVNIHTTIEPCSKEAISLPTSVRKVDSYWKYAYGEGLYLPILDEPLSKAETDASYDDGFSYGCELDGAYYLHLGEDYWGDRLMIYYDEKSNSYCLLEKDNFDEMGYREASDPIYDEVKMKQMEYFMELKEKGYDGQLSDKEAEFYKVLEAEAWEDYQEESDYEEPSIGEFAIDKTKLRYLKTRRDKADALISLSELESYGFYFSIVGEDGAKQIRIYENPFK